MDAIGDRGFTHICFDHSAGSQLGLLPMLGHPVELNVEGLIAKAFRQEVVGEVLDDLLRQPREDVNGSDIEDLVRAGR